MLHTDLPIYKKGYDLLTLAADVHLNMPRTFKQSLGRRVHDECVDLLLEIGYANASRGEKRCEHIRNVLRGLEVVSLMMRVSADKGFVSWKLWARAIEMTNILNRQAGGWLKKSATASDSSGPRLP
ncbi:four helix bundle protein [Propionivibrio sp.]|jgi:DNA recombination-dependent growth factor C|uniref:four helix bundle protein n=1 Tax=Propionivibrio sp. TaxID=2212460 RepID=UPI0039E3B16E